jgi:hypothetical protein
MSDANGPSDTYAALYRRAFELFGTRALWNRKPVPDPTPEDALAITHSLRVEGNLEAPRLAERIEAACGDSPRYVARKTQLECDSTKLEWTVDSYFRFFPNVPDDTFGCVLHPVDLATNKVAAAYGRREPRDVVDIITIHDRILPLGAAVWASAGKALGFTPERIVNEMRRLARYTEADFRGLESDPPIDAHGTMQRYWAILNEAEVFIAQMPTDLVGLPFLKQGRPVQPDPSRLHEYQTHAVVRRGHWPGREES